MLGDILRRGVSLIMLPIYTRYLTPADYGVVELLSMLLDLTAIIFSARAGQAVFRFYCTAESENKKKGIISSALLLSAVMSGLGTLTVIIFSGPLAIAVFSDVGYKSFISLFAITLFLNPLIEIPLIHIRAQQKPWLFLLFSMTKLALQLSLNIYFVVVLELHVEGVIYSAVISGIIMAVVLTGYSISKAGLKATTAITRSLFSFSLPLKLAALGSFYMAFGDRYILNIFTDLTQVGIYSLGYKFGFVLLMLTWDPFQNMWDAEKYEIFKKDNARHIYQKVFIYTSSILILVGLCISLFVKDLLRIMADPSFLDAYKIVPIIVVAYIFQAWTKYCNMGILLENKTMQIAYGEMVGVSVITLAYFTLIPLYGIYGAAWSTITGFAARFYWTNLKSTQLYNMELPWAKISLIALVATLIYFLSMLSPESIVPSILFRSTLVIVFIAIFFMMPILSRNEKKVIWGKIRSLQSAPGS
jgi:O-antigen/teichoic acid export membrane protein